MTPDSFSIPAHLTGRLDTPGTCANSLAFDLTALTLDDDSLLAVELLIEQPQAARCRVVEFHDGTGRFYGSANVGPGAGPVRVLLNSSASEDVRSASGGFFTVDAVLADADGVHHAFSLGTRRVALLTVARRESAMSMRGAA